MCRIIREMMENPSEWRHMIAEKIAAGLDMDHFGVKGIYLIGSTKRFSAGPGSDIDLLVHFAGSDDQKRELLAWFRGWGECLAVFNGEIYASQSNNLLDIHFISDDDIRQQTSFGVMINSMHDRAKPLKVK